MYSIVGADTRESEFFTIGMLRGGRQRVLDRVAWWEGKAWVVWLEGLRLNEVEVDLPRIKKLEKFQHDPAKEKA